MPACTHRSSHRSKVFVKLQTTPQTAMVLQSLLAFAASGVAAGRGAPFGAVMVGPIGFNQLDNGTSYHAKQATASPGAATSLIELAADRARKAEDRLWYANKEYRRLTFLDFPLFLIGPSPASHPPPPPLPSVILRLRRKAPLILKSRHG